MIFPALEDALLDRRLAAERMARLGGVCDLIRADILAHRSTGGAVEAPADLGLLSDIESEMGALRAVVGAPIPHERNVAPSHQPYGARRHRRPHPDDPEDLVARSQRMAAVPPVSPGEVFATLAEPLLAWHSHWRRMARNGRVAVRRKCASDGDYFLAADTGEPYPCRAYIRRYAEPQEAEMTIRRLAA